MNNKVITAAAVMAYIICAAVLVWKIPYGWGAYDEPFYLSTPYRFLLSNDIFIADEWNAAQLSSFLLLIPLKLFSFFVPDMEGVVFTFRVIFTVVHLTFTLAVALLLKKEGPAGYLAGLCYLLFIPFNIMNFSYDAIGLSCVTIIAISVYSKKEPGKLRLFIMGILFSFAVLCNPYLALVFMVYFILCIVGSAKKRGVRYLNLKDLIPVLAGVLLPALIFLILLFSRTSLESILKNLPEMMNDPTHGDVSLVSKALDTFLQLSKIFFPGIYQWLVLFAIQFFDRGRDKRKNLYIILSALVFIISIAGFVLSVRVNCYMLPMALFGLNMYLISQKRDRRTLYLWFAGLIYGIFMWMASDQGVYIISMALLISDLASVMFIRDVFEENRKVLFKYAFLAVLSVQLITELVGISRSTHWESERIEKLDTVYERGPLKGLRTTADKVETYDRILGDIEMYRDGRGERIAFMTLNTWEYLYAGRPYGTFSAWLGYTDSFTAEKFIKWCRLHPEKLPQDIYFSKLEEKGWDTADIDMIAKELDMDVEENDVNIRMRSRKTLER